MITGFELAVPFAQLRLNFFGDEIDGCVQIIFGITSDEILAGQGHLHCARVSFVGVTYMIALEIHECSKRMRFLVIKLLDAYANMILETIG